MTDLPHQARILIVDDVRANVKVLVEILRADYKISVAMDGKTALAVVDREPPDLILLDVMMPEMDGYQVCQRLKAEEKYRNILIIFVTAKDEAQDETKGFEMGAVDYITKPFSKTVVQARVRNHIELKRHRDAMQAMMEDLKKSTEAAEAANRAKSGFLANMSHEIRTPMNSIIGMTELVLEGETNPTHQKYLGIAIDSAKSLLSLINNILDLSKIESGKLLLEPMVFDLRQLVESNLETMEILARSKKLALMRQIDDNVAQCFVGDPTRLHQVLTNLLGNAIKFTEKGGVTVTVTGRGEGVLRFAVADTGVGIPLDRQQHIFESFTQADQSTTRKYGGTGLGTTIAKEIVEKMGGRIWVESEVNRGSAFFFEINLPEAEGMTECRCQPRHVAKAGAARTPLAILVAEDVEANRALVITRLEQRGHRVTVAEDGLLALAAYEEQTFDVILMDLQMPGMDGIEVTRTIRQWEARLDPPPHIPIIALTAHSMADDRNKCLAVGMDDYVVKPIDFDLLYGVLARFFPANAEDGGGTSPTLEVKKSVTLPQLAGIDVASGLERWQDGEIYRKAILGFVQSRGDDGEKIRVAMTLDNVEEALGLAHALKGAAGSLAATTLAAAATALEAALQLPEPDWQPLVVQVERALTEITKACRPLATTPTREGNAACVPVGAILPQHRDLVTRIAQALDHGDAMTAEDLLPELTQWLKGTLHEADVALLATQVEEIDCTAARKILTKIIQALGVE